MIVLYYWPEELYRCNKGYQSVDIELIKRDIFQVEPTSSYQPSKSGSRVQRKRESEI